MFTLNTIHFGLNNYIHFDVFVQGLYLQFVLDLRTTVTSWMKVLDATMYLELESVL